MSPRVDAWVDKYGWQLLTILLAGSAAVATARAQLNGKADRAELQTLDYKLDVVVKRQEATLRMLCRDPRNRSDSACP